jgi:hypothetical protein
MAIRIGQAPTNQASTGFFKPKANQTHKVILLQDTKDIVTVDQNEIWEVTPAIIWPHNGPGDPGDELHLRPALRSFIAVLVDEDPAPKLWAMGKGQHQALVDISDANDGESLAGMIVQVKRTGAGLETRYSVTATPKRIKTMPADIPTSQDIIGRLNVRDNATVKAEIIARLGMTWEAIVEMFTEKWMADQEKRKNSKKGAGTAEAGDVEAL